jgi:hypothetical protein
MLLSKIKESFSFLAEGGVALWPSHRETVKASLVRGAGQGVGQLGSPVLSRQKYSEKLKREEESR